MRLYKVHGGWWRIDVIIDGEHGLIVRLGTRDAGLARQKFERYRKTEEHLACPKHRAALDRLRTEQETAWRQLTEQLGI